MPTIRVVLADNHSQIRASLRQGLSKIPEINIIGEASNGFEALRILRTHHIDVVILDMDMPGLTGLDVIRRIRTENLPVRVLALSAHDDVQLIKGILDSGAQGYVPKHAGLTAVINGVQRLAHLSPSA